jgi:Ca2+-binding EF-hand superfamily protein
MELDAAQVAALEDKVRVELAQHWNEDATSLRRLAKHTAFTRPQLAELQQHFQGMYDADETQGISREEFVKLVVKATADDTKDGASTIGTTGDGDELVVDTGIDSVMAARLFDLYDKDKSGAMDFQELTCCLSVLMQGTPQQKLNMCFDAYDADGSSRLEAGEVKALAASLVRQLPVDEKTAIKGDGKGPGASQERLDALTKKLMALDTDSDDSLSRDEFFKGVSGEDDLMACFPDSSVAEKAVAQVLVAEAPAPQQDSKALNNAAGAPPSDKATTISTDSVHLHAKANATPSSPLLNGRAPLVGDAKKNSDGSDDDENADPGCCACCVIL